MKSVTEVSRPTRYGHEHRRAEHREEVLQRERDALEERQALVHVDGARRHGGSRQAMTK